MLNRTLGLVTAPTVEPVTLLEAKTHLRVDNTAEDALIALLIASAREHVEGATGRALMQQEWAFGLTAFPGTTGAIELPRPPLQTVLSFQSYAEASIGVTMTGWQLVADTGPYAQPGKLYPAAGASWPGIVGDGMRRVVYIQYRAGYASASAVPAPLRAAMLLLLGDLYENREAAVRRDMVANPAVERLLNPYRLVTV